MVALASSPEPPKPMRKRFLFVLVVATSLLGLTYACVEPPPKIAAIPSTGLAVRLHVFGASALDARRTFDAAKENNKNFRIVQEGGDGEVLVGLDNDSPKCVEPTALCSLKIAYRVRDAKGELVASGTESVNANGEHCGDLCDRALNNAVVKVIEISAAALKGGGSTRDGGGEQKEGGTLATSNDAGAPEEAPDATPPSPKPEPKGQGKKKPPKSDLPPPPPPPKPEPPICAVGHGLRLKSEEAERRVAQVEALKRLNVLDQDEYDCLRKAYLDRL